MTVENSNQDATIIKSNSAPISILRMFTKYGFHVRHIFFIAVLTLSNADTTQPADKWIILQEKLKAPTLHMESRHWN